MVNDLLNGPNPKGEHSKCQIVKFRKALTLSLIVSVLINTNKVGCGPTTTINQTYGVLLARPHALFYMTHPVSRLARTLIVFLSKILTHPLGCVLFHG